MEHHECIQRTRIRRAWCRKTGDKINDAIGELSSTGNENVIPHFECVLFIAECSFDCLQSKTLLNNVLVFWRTSDEVMP